MLVPRDLKYYFLHCEPSLKKLWNVLVGILWEIWTETMNKSFRLGLEWFSGCSGCVCDI